MNANSVSTKNHLDVEVVERNDAPGVWSVEASDHNSDGEIYQAIFPGLRSRERAVEYARMKYQR